MSPPIQVFLTTIASQPALRQRQDYLLRTLQVKKIPFTSYDLASDEVARRLWKRKAPPGEPLPGILVGGVFPGTFSEFEDAVEFDDLDTFLRRNDMYDPAVEEDRPLLPSQPIGVPGVATSLQMTPERLRPALLAGSSSSSSSPLSGKAAIPVNKREDEFDVGTEFSGFGLQGVKVSEDDLAALVSELGLEGDDATELVKGLSTASPSQKEAKADVTLTLSVDNTTDLLETTPLADTAKST